MVNVTNHTVGIISHEVLVSNCDPMIYVNYILIKLEGKRGKYSKEPSSELVIFFFLVGGGGGVERRKEEKKNQISNNVPIDEVL